jgi:hypothetical protein
MNGLFRKGCVTAGAVIAVAAATPTAASATPQSCPNYPVSQPFQAWGDTNQYALLSGESIDNVDGTGWQLSGGAKLVTARLADAAMGQVLDLPKGASAVTAPICVNSSQDPEARTMVADLSGTSGVATYVAYASLSGGDWGWPSATGNVKYTWSGFGLSKPIMLHAGGLKGLHLARFTFTAFDGEYQLYNFYVDPRRSH